MADSNFERTIARILSREQALTANGKVIEQFMTKMGAAIVLKAKQNVVRWRAVDTGRLLNSLGFRVDKSLNTIRMSAGTINTFIRYGRITEFGGVFSPSQMRAMFAALHARGVEHHQGKHVMIENRLPPRPFLIPAFKEVTRDMGKQLRDLFAATGEA